MKPAVIPPEVPSRMSAQEWRIGGVLAGIFGLRMLGLFLVLPVLALHAEGLPGGEDFQRVAWAFGIFMLVQACLYLPLGRLSDRLGRKPVIAAGLLVFAAGSVMAAWAPTVDWLIAARAIQGAGAISAAVMALAADLTRAEHRTKVMAMIGSTIGLVFALSLVLAPALYGWIGMAGMFVLIAVLAVLAVGALYAFVPTPPIVPAQRRPFGAVLRDAALLRLNFGIFALHVMQTALFLVMPRELILLHGLDAALHWQVYLPVLLASFVLAVPAIVVAERYGRGRLVFLGSLASLLVAQAGLLFGVQHFVLVLVMLGLFFAAFNVLEASLPSLVSRMAPADARGAALGVFNTTQALGVALGSVLGGWIAVHSGAKGVHGMTVVLTLIWVVIALGMRMPGPRPDAGEAPESADQPPARDAALRVN